MTDKEKEPLPGAPKTAPRDTGTTAPQSAPDKQAADGVSAAKTPKTFTRRAVVGGAIGAGIIGLVAGGVLAKWGVVEDSVANGRIELGVTPTKLIVTDRARCSGCQRCELSCTLRNDGRASHASARVQVWRNYNFGHGLGSGDGCFGNCEFTVEHCKQCKDSWCVNICPVHAINADPKTGARVIDPNKCIGCGRCAQQCPNGAIKFVDWKDIAQEAIDRGLVSTTGLFTAEELQKGSDDLASKVDYSTKKDK